MKYTPIILNPIVIGDPYSKVKVRKKLWSEFCKKKKVNFSVCDLLAPFHFIPYDRT
jgi:hypothetical protein